MTSRPTDPRKNDRRGSDNGDLGYGVAIGATPSLGKRWPAPQDIRQLNAMTRQRAATGRCVVCGTTTDAAGVTCKSVACVRAFVLGQVV